MKKLITLTAILSLALTFSAFSQDADADGWSPGMGDCNDNNNAIYPGAPELCNGYDDDCDGTTDEGVVIPIWYRDLDNDGYGAFSISIQACTQTPGYVANYDDCNDSDNGIYPGATELCNNKDDDCDGSTDEGIVIPTWYPDLDNDGYGNSSISIQACAQPPSHAANFDDCNDSDNGIYPGAAEVCNGRDDDCDGSTDEGIIVPTWYIDQDSDGYGIASTTMQACLQPPGYAVVSGDCDDSNFNINPGTPEICGNAMDDNCDTNMDDCYTLTLTTNGTGAGTVSSDPAGINCVLTCSYTFPSGSIVTIDANPDPGSSFSGWGGDASSCGSIPVCGIALLSNSIASATFSCMVPDAPGSISGNASVCIGSSHTYSVLDIPFATSYTWTLPSGATGNSTTNSITVNYGTSAISDNITVKGNNSCGEGGISTLAISVNPVYNFTENHSICEGEGYRWRDGITYSTTGTYTISYNTTNGCDSIYSLNLMVNPPYLSEETVHICEGENYFWQGQNYNTRGTFMATYQTSSGCDSILSLTLIIDRLPRVEHENVAVCEGDSLTLTGNEDGVVFSWSNGVINGVPFLPIETFEIILTGTEPTNGCSISIPVNVEVRPLPLVDAGQDLIVCPDQELILFAGGDANEFYWDHGIINGVPSIPTEEGTYIVLGYSYQTGCTKSDTMNLSFHIPPLALAGSDTEICPGDSVTLTSGGNADSYEWSDEAVQDGIPLPVFITTTFILTGLDLSTGCLAYDSVTITVKPLIVDAGYDRVVCPGDSIALTASGNADAWSWDNGVTDGVRFAPALPGQYGLTGSSLSLGCTFTDYVFVNVTPIIDAGPDLEACAGNPVTLNADLINCGNCYIAWGEEPNNWTFVPVSSGDYIVAAYDFESGCGMTDTVHVAVHPLPVVSAGSDITACAGDNVTLTGNSNVSEYFWNNGVIDQIPFIASYTTSFIFTGTDSITTCVNTDEMILIVNPNPLVFAGNDIAVCENNALIFSGSGTAGAYTWNNGITNGVAFHPSSGGTFIVTGTNTLTGCESTDSVNLVVFQQPIVSAGQEVQVCAGDQVILSGQGNAQNYLWNNGITNGIPFIPSYSDVYTVTGSNANGCENSDMVVVTVTNPPNVTIVGLEPGYCLNHDPVFLFGVPSGGEFSGAGMDGSYFNPALADTGTHSIYYAFTDNNGCVGYDSIVVHINPCTGFNENSNDLLFTLTPNPTTGILYFEKSNKGTCEIQIYNALGESIRLLKVMDGDRTIIDLSPYPTGVYMLKIETEDAIKTVRVVKI